MAADGRAEMQERGRVLVVEDEVNARQALVLLLEDEGHEVAEAGDGVEALEVIDRGWVPEVVLTDVRMPRLDGIALIDELHRRIPDVPVIVMTAYGSIEHAVETLRLGAADYIRKPIELQRVLAALDRVTTAPDRELRIGDRIAGRYRIDALIGEGAMGKVYRATHLHLGREVALKLLNPRRGGAEGRARFLREAQVAASLRHPNVVQIHDFGSDRGRPYLVMELLHGRDLRSALVAHGGALDLQQVLWIGATVAAVLVETHRTGLVHRDLKPENIFLEDHNHVRVLDFGLAFIERAGQNDGRLTEEGMVVGTPFYIAPEQASGLVISPAVDIYSFGCLLYEMLSGAPPFLGNSIQVMSSHLYEDPLPLSELVAGLSPRLDSLILGMLHKLPKWRPTARQVESELRSIAHESGVDLAIVPALPEEPEAQLRVLTVGKVSASLTASLARRGVLVEPSRGTPDQLSRVAAIYASDCALTAIRELAATGIPVVADLEAGDQERSRELRELGVAARVTRPINADQLAAALNRVAQRRRSSVEETTTLRLRRAPTT
jgi:serine/threonine protein kinase/CheY-like chemotaxis protein